ncbi:PREDICTED: putative uncharacterized protein DDB_G0271606 [Priapulus caudatus]|uniref:Uncharacterized protein n=1 Tax=Priapulus caudatus TaxID=37621 RepID=A0ABM1F2B4_PRICU|nr:PREDICTED: putative uncharacterized protein DDB_G0271606 [Priapulus caudatus]
MEARCRPIPRLTDCLVSCSLSKEKPKLDLQKSRTLKMIQDMESPKAGGPPRPLPVQVPPPQRQQQQQQPPSQRYNAPADSQVQSGGSFKLLQMMTEEAGEREVDDEAQMKAARIRRKQEEDEDEMSFGGLRKATPSVSMRMLEKSLPAEGETQYVPPEPEPEVHTRYRGAAIPSRSFRMLQQMTGGPGEADTSTPLHTEPEAAPEQPHGNPAELPHEKDPRKYTGANIPGRCFKMLQQMTAENEDSGQQQQQQQDQQQHQEAAQQQQQEEVAPAAPSYEATSQQPADQLLQNGAEVGVAAAE